MDAFFKEKIANPATNIVQADSNRAERETLTLWLKIISLRTKAAQSKLGETNRARLRGACRTQYLNIDWRS